MRFLSLILLIFCMLSLSSCEFLKTKVFGKKARIQAELKARQDSIRVADSLKKVRDLELALEAARQDSLRRAEEERLAMETRYNIIVGSFVTPEYAKNLAAEYTGMGYNVRIIKPENSKFELVAAEGHKDLRSAIRRLGQFQDTVMVESWLYTKP